MPDQLSARWTGFLFLAITTTGWAANWVAIKILLREWPPLFSRGVSGVAAGLLMAAVALAFRESLKVPRRAILQLLDMSLRGQGVQIFIGRESGYQILDDCSVVTAPYSSDTGAVGVIGVIGPTRMSYERVIPVVQATAQIISGALKRA